MTGIATPVAAGPDLLGPDLARDVDLNTAAVTLAVDATRLPAAIARVSESTAPFVAL